MKPRVHSSSFFSEPVAYLGKRPGAAGAVQHIGGNTCAVMVDDGMYEPQTATESRVHQRTFFIRFQDWEADAPPQVGDILEPRSGGRFGVREVHELPHLGYNLAAREVS